PNPQSYSVSKQGSYDGSFIDSNSLIQFESIQLENIQEVEDSPFHFKVDFNNDEAKYDENSLYPKIKISNCNNFSGSFGEIIADILIENSTVNQLLVGGKGKMPG